MAEAAPQSARAATMIRSSLPISSPLGGYGATFLSRSGLRGGGGPGGLRRGLRALCRGREQGQDPPDQDGRGVPDQQQEGRADEDGPEPERAAEPQQEDGPLAPQEEEVTQEDEAQVQELIRAEGDQPRPGLGGFALRPDPQEVNEAVAQGQDQPAGQGPLPGGAEEQEIHRQGVEKGVGEQGAPVAPFLVFRQTPPLEQIVSDQVGRQQQQQYLHGDSPLCL